MTEVEAAEIVLGPPEWVKCGCHGGYIDEQRGDDPPLIMSIQCPKCHGTGAVLSERCAEAYAITGTPHPSGWTSETVNGMTLWKGPAVHVGKFPILQRNFPIHDEGDWPWNKP